MDQQITGLPGEHLRILMICPQFRPMVGGYERAAERLSLALSRLGHSVTIVTFRLQRCWPANETQDGFQIIRLWCSKRRAFSSISSIVSLLWYLVQHGRQFQIWHAHAVTPAVAAAFFIGRLLGVKCVLKLPSSGLGGVSATADFGFFGRIGLVPAGIRLTHAVIALSSQAVEEGRKFFGRAMCIASIPNGIDIELFRPASAKAKAEARRALGIPDGALVVSQVGRLSSEKNVEGLLQAWAGLPSNVRATSMLHVVGEGALRPKLTHLVGELGLQGQVFLPGSRSDVTLWYHASDLYVLSSSYEGLSNSMLEAMACGLPVVSTSVSGSEVVLRSGAGIVVPVQQIPALRRALLTLMTNAAMRAEFGRNARREIVKTFRMESVAKQCAELYRMLTNINGDSSLIVEAP